MNFKRLLHTEFGKICISIVLGLGLATMFRKVCKDKDCIVFNGPVIREVDTKTFKHDGSCFQYTIESTACDKTKQIISISNNEKENKDAAKPFLMDSLQPVPSVPEEKKGFLGFW
jgi:hypothetical protein